MDASQLVPLLVRQFLERAGYSQTLDAFDREAATIAALDLQDSVAKDGSTQATVTPGELAHTDLRTLAEHYLSTLAAQAQAKAPSLLDDPESDEAKEKRLLSLRLPPFPPTPEYEVVRTLEALHANNVLSLSLATLPLRRFDTSLARYVVHRHRVLVSTSADKRILLVRLPRRSDTPSINIAPHSRDVAEADGDEVIDSLEPGPDAHVAAPLCTVQSRHFPAELVSAGMDGRVIVWDLATRAPFQVLRHHTKFVVRLAFSEDGRWLASCSYDRTVRVYRRRRPPAGASAAATAGAWADASVRAEAGASRQLASPPTTTADYYRARIAELLGADADASSAHHERTTPGADPSSTTAEGQGGAAGRNLTEAAPAASPEDEDEAMPAGPTGFDLVHTIVTTSNPESILFCSAPLPAAPERGPPRPPQGSTRDAATGVPTATTAAAAAVGAAGIPTFEEGSATTAAGDEESGAVGGGVASARSRLRRRRSKRTWLAYTRRADCFLHYVLLPRDDEAQGGEEEGEHEERREGGGVRRAGLDDARAAGSETTTAAAGGADEEALARQVERVSLRGERASDAPPPPPTSGDDVARSERRDGRAGLGEEAGESDLDDWSVLSFNTNANTEDMHVSYSLLHLTLHPGGDHISVQTGDHSMPTTGASAAAVASLTSRILLLPLLSSRRCCVLWTGTPSSAFAAPRHAWSARGGGVWCGSEEGVLRLVELATGRVRCTVAAHGYAVEARRRAREELERVARGGGGGGGGASAGGGGGGGGGGEVGGLERSARDAGVSARWARGGGGNTVIKDVVVLPPDDDDDDDEVKDLGPSSRPRGSSYEEERSWPVVASCGFDRTVRIVAPRSLAPTPTHDGAERRAAGNEGGVSGVL